MDQNSQGHPRRRVAVACTRCRKRKIRCSGDPGNGSGCQNCRQAGVDYRACIFTRVGSHIIDANQSSTPNTSSLFLDPLPHSQISTSIYSSSTSSTSSSSSISVSASSSSSSSKPSPSIQSSFTSVDNYLSAPNWPSSTNRFIDPNPLQSTHYPSDTLSLSLSLPVPLPVPSNSLSTTSSSSSSIPVAAAVTSPGSILPQNSVSAPPSHAYSVYPSTEPLQNIWPHHHDLSRPWNSLLISHSYEPHSLYLDNEHPSNYLQMPPQIPTLPSNSSSSAHYIPPSNSQPNSHPSSHPSTHDSSYLSYSSTNFLPSPGDSQCSPNSAKRYFIEFAAERQSHLPIDENDPSFNQTLLPQPQPHQAKHLLPSTSLPGKLIYSPVSRQDSTYSLTSLDAKCPHLNVDRERCVLTPVDDKFYQSATSDKPLSTPSYQDQSSIFQQSNYQPSSDSSLISPLTATSTTRSIGSSSTHQHLKSFNYTKPSLQHHTHHHPNNKPSPYHSPSVDPSTYQIIHPSLPSSTFHRSNSSTIHDHLASDDHSATNPSCTKPVNLNPSHHHLLQTPLMTINTTKPASIPSRPKSLRNPYTLPHLETSVSPSSPPPKALSHASSLSDHATSSSPDVTGLHVNLPTFIPNVVHPALPSTSTPSRPSPSVASRYSQSNHDQSSRTKTSLITPSTESSKLIPNHSMSTYDRMNRLSSGSDIISTNY